MKHFKITLYLGIISILGYLSILVSSISGINIGSYIDSLLFLIIGTALSISGGIKLFFKYFKDGLTVGELNKIVTVVIGVASFVVGILTFPLIGIELDVFAGIKAVISMIAIIVILIEIYEEEVQ